MSVKHIFNVTHILLFLVLVRAAPVSYLGCFIDNASRDLPYMHYSDTHMSIELCAHHCRGFQYMSLQVGSWDGEKIRRDSHRNNQPQRHRDCQIQRLPDTETAKDRDCQTRRLPDTETARHRECQTPRLLDTERLRDTEIDRHRDCQTQRLPDTETARHGN